MQRNFFLDHPVFSIVISIVIVIVGTIGLVMLPVDQYPQIVPPVVKVTASYPGADAQTVTQAVATPIEQELNGTPGMIYMSSSSSNSGGFTARITFDIDTDPELAAVDVQNRLKKAESRLPAEVVQNGISVEKETATRLMTITILSDDPKYDEIYLSNYATLNVIDLLRRIPGVGSISNVGGRYYAMQIWVQPDKMADLGITVKDLQDALRDQNRESAAGVLGQSPSQGVDRTLPIVARGRLSSVREFEDIVVRANADGSLIRLRDVARVSLEASSYATESGINGGNAAVLNITMLPGANAMDVAERVRQAMDEIAQRFPEGISYQVPFDMTTYISESIHHVYRTFFEALLLVILVVFLSLQSWRATLIPIIAVPISLVGTFGVMLVFGFSLNMLTLLGLILAIGIVVDDAIVVVENVDRIMEHDHVDAPEATRRAMSGLGSALVAMSLVLCAVFVPVSFLPGITGQLYRQFTITIAVSVIISTVVAMTLSPVMCAKLLRPHTAGGRKNRLFRAIDRGLAAGNGFYSRRVVGALRSGRRMWAAFGIALVFIYVMNSTMPQSFMTAEDQGYFTVELELPEGSSIERTRTVTDRAIQALMADPDVQHVLNVTGSSPRVGTNQAHSTLTVILKPWDERTTHDLGAVRGRVLAQLSAYPECAVYISTPPIIPGLGTSGGFEMVLEARGEAGYAQLQAAVDTLVACAAQTPELADLSVSLQADIPQLYFDVDRDRAKMYGVPMSDVFSTMKAYTGSVYINDFNMFNRIYRVYIQADAPYRERRADLGLFAVRSAAGQMIPVTALGTSHYTTGPGTIGRFNMFNSATVSGEAAPGYSTGQAMDALERLVATRLPADVAVEWSGLSYQQKHEGGNTAMVLGLAFLFVFLVLAALYESWSVPVAVILSLPVAGVGAYLGIWICGLENNVYFQIGLVMLVGLVAKNAILIVEFAKEGVERGLSPAMAAVSAARLRFRPIVMTSLAFMLGLLPLVFASGPGSAARRDIGTGVFFGMAVAITLGIVFVPFFFVQVCRFNKWLAARRERRSSRVKAGALPVALVAAAMGLASCSGMGKLTQADVGSTLPPAYAAADSVAAAGAPVDTLTAADVQWWQLYSDPKLVAIIKRVLDNNKDLLIAAARVEELRQLHNIDRMGYMPTVSGIVGATRETNDYYGEKFTGDTEVSFKGILNWEANLWGAVSRQRQQSAAQYMAGLHDWRAMRIELIAQTASAYIQLIALNNQLAIVRQTLDTRRQALDKALLRYKGGLTSELVYQQAKVEYETTAALVPGYEQRIQAMRNALSLLCGEYPIGQVDVTGMALSEFLPQRMPVGVPSQLLERRPDLQASESRLRAAMAGVGLEYANRFPSVKIGITAGWENDGVAHLLQSPFTYLLGNITGTIFDFGRRKRRYQAAIAAYDQARLTYERDVQAAFTEVTDAASAYRHTQATTDKRAQLREAAIKYVDLANKQYIAGTISYMDVLDAQRRFFDAQIDHTSALRDQYLALVALYKALGGGWQPQ